ncbi:uncharacterized protein LOC127080319 [Lathyrus oleraceus]|uniref:uncharacterized protein LOC127080319 n=1 Tax=Pisum sativum TaxID=3888 RepID=UPI0021CE7F49|nr:uncharacterized protein LOC127080319 [Pisum sativum]
MIQEKRKSHKIVIRVINRRRLLEFKEGDHVFLKVTLRLRLKGSFKSQKFSTRYIRHVLLDTVKMETNISFEPQPSRLVGRETKLLRNKEILLVKVQWDESHPGEATWELESKMREVYPYLF